MHGPIIPRLPVRIVLVRIERNSVSFQGCIEYRMVIRLGHDRRKFRIPTYKIVYVLIIGHIPCQFIQIDIAIIPRIFALDNIYAIEQFFAVIEFYGIGRQVQAPDIVHFQRIFVIIIEIIPYKLCGTSNRERWFNRPSVETFDIMRSSSPFPRGSSIGFDSIIVIFIERTSDFESMMSTLVIVSDGIALRQVNRMSIGR